MKKSEMTAYLLDELTDLKKDMDEQETAMKKETDKFERVKIAAQINIKSKLYYHFWMVCNDLGIIPKNG